MNVAIAYHPADEEQAHRWFAWCAELGVGAAHGLTVLPFKGITAPEIKGWAKVTVLRDYSGVRSDWDAPGPIRDAAGPNFMFRELARHFYEAKAGRWLFMEPDAIFLRRTAIDEIEAEHLAAGKRFMGARVDAPNTPVHLSGIAVYPGDLAVTAPNYMNPRLAQFDGRQVEGAFNLAGAPDALEEMHETKLIQQAFRHPPFTSLAEVERDVSREAAVFHSDKSGSLLSFLKGGDEPCQTVTPVFTNQTEAQFNGAAKSNPSPAPMNAADHIAELCVLSKKDGFAKGRICKQLAAAGFVVKGRKRK